MNKQCRNCGAYMSSESLFCSKCGGSDFVVFETQPQANVYGNAGQGQPSAYNNAGQPYGYQQMPNSQAWQNVAPQNSQPAQHYQYSQESQAPKKKTGLVVGIIIALIIGSMIFAIVGIGVVVSCAIQKEESKGNGYIINDNGDMSEGDNSFGFDESTSSSAPDENKSEQNSPAYTNSKPNATSSAATSSTAKPNSTNKTTYGAATVDELISILSSNYLFTEKQLDCANMPMFEWAFNSSCSTDWEHSLNERNAKEVAPKVNAYLFNGGDLDRMKIKIGTLKTCKYDVYSKYLLEHHGEVHEKLVREEKANLQGVWIANYTIQFENGMNVTVYADDYEDPSDMEGNLFIYKISGRYYWSFLNVYEY